MYACIHLRLRFRMFLFLYGLIVCVIILFILDNKQYIVVAALGLCVIERNHIEHLFFKCYFVSSNSLVGVFLLLLLAGLFICSLLTFTPYHHTYSTRHTHTTVDVVLLLHVVSDSAATYHKYRELYLLCSYTEV